MVEEAASWGAALAVGEWGADPRQDASHVYAQAFLELSEERLVGHALWLWKEQNQEGSWGLFGLDEETGTWAPREQAFRGFIVPYVQAAPGRLLSHRFQQSTRVLEARFAAEGDARGLDARCHQGSR